MFKAPMVVSLFALAATTCSVAEEWKSLFDGKSLDGWTANESPKSWMVEDGAIVAKGERSHLFYTGEVGNHDFKNFVFSAEVKTMPGANSGIYVHTQLKGDPWPQIGYECQVVNTSRAFGNGYQERKMTGSVYAVRNNWSATVQDGEWFHYKIKVSGKTIQTYINGELICEYTEGNKPWRADDKQGRYLGSGTIAFQCHDPESIVHYRDIKIKMLPDDAASLGVAESDRELDELITQFSDQNFALIDFGIVPGSQALVDAQLATARRYGVTLGYLYPKELTDFAKIGRSGAVVLVNDRDTPPSIELLKAAKASGAKIAFSSGGVARLDPVRLKQRLQAMKRADLDWEDIWVPGKS